MYLPVYKAWDTNSHSGFLDLRDPLFPISALPLWACCLGPLKQLSPICVASNPTIPGPFDYKCQVISVPQQEAGSTHLAPRMLETKMKNLSLNQHLYPLSLLFSTLPIPCLPLTQLRTLLPLSSDRLWQLPPQLQTSCPPHGNPSSRRTALSGPRIAPSSLN